jgi:hypothetical protein
MKAGYVVGLIAIGAAGVLAGIGLGHRVSFTSKDCPSCDRLITINENIDGTCEVDFPVAVLREQSNTIQWQATDDTKSYYINFSILRHKVGNPPASYTPKTPLRDANGKPADNLYVAKNNPSGKYVVAYDPKPSPNTEPNYYYYAIYHLDPNTSSSGPCKEPFSDHDTGVNVKR